MDEKYELDVRGLHCPLPALRTRAKLDTLLAGEVLTIYVTDPASIIDFPHLCNVTGHVLVDQKKENGEFIYRIRRRP